MGIFIIFILAFSCLSISAQTLEGTVVKRTTGNPSLGIVTFEGEPVARRALEAMLVRCDWFKVLPDAQVGRAQIQLSVTVENKGANTVLQGSLKYSGKEVILQGAGSTINLAAAELTDAILRHLFKVPAMCTRPIFYVRTGLNGRKELFSCYIDGSASKRVTHNNAISTEPSWGHAGALVYTLNTGKSLSVVLMDVANNRQRAVSSVRGLNASPALSRDGRTLILPLSFGQQVDLYAMDLATGKRTQLTKDRDVESSPCISPDGKEVCFVSDRSSRPQLYRMPVNGGRVTRLQLGGSEAVSPDWSPVTNKLCYAARNASGRYAIAVIDMASANPTPEIVTQAAGDWEAPSWAPDGRHLICTRKSGGKQNLYIVDTWFKSFQQITAGSGFSLPAWCPAN